LTAPPATTPGWDIVVGLDAGAPGLWSIPSGDSGIGWVETSPIATGPILSDPGYHATGFASMGLAFAAPAGDGVVTSLTLPNVFPSLPGQWTEGGFIYLPIPRPRSLFRLEQVMIEQHIGERNALMLQQLRIVVDQTV